MAVLRNFNDLEKFRFDDENSPTITSEEQV